MPQPPQLIESVQLFFQEGTSDKVYHASLYGSDDGTFTVEVEWGRRGSKLNKGRKAVNVSRAAAKKVFDRLVHEKTSKGYEVFTETAKPAAVAPPEGEGSGSRAKGVRKKVGFAAQLLNPIEDSRLDSLLDDDQYVAQQKLDGSRVLLHVDKGKVLATNRAGQATSCAADVLEGVSTLPPGTVVDGEVVATDGAAKCWLFDVLTIAGEDVRALGYWERWVRLAEELEPGLSGPVEVLQTAATPSEKRALLDSLWSASAEGIVFKQRSAPYTPGRPASGGTQLKHKFVKTADVVLVENVGNAYRMVVWERDEQRDVGKVFSGTTNLLRADLDARLASGEEIVAEVRYLYATDDDQLFQPVLVRLRDDKEGRECLLSQLVRTNRRVL
ncbi:MAG: RNA ligase family protein [Polyangiaceae bacterium]